MFDSQALDCFKKSGDIVARLRKEVPTIAKPGVPAIKICEGLEQKMRDQGGKPAFPVNVGINEVAAHYTSPPGDPLTVPPGCLAKIDFGVQVDGYVTDTSVTVCFEPKLAPLVQAADEALASAIRAFRPGVRLSEIGRVVQTIIQKYGLRPISNLTGHKIERYTIHAGKSVPNVAGMNGARIEEGEVYAIEPFVTLPKAAGAVTNGSSAYIYRYVKPKGATTQDSRKVLAYIQTSFSTLPFASRWLAPSFERETAKNALSDLIKHKCVSAYPVLVEQTSNPVAQSEHTVLVNKGGCSILTGS
ncbi:MAG TPA: type II methionyl aminopeptidase [Candidatus Dormibacteraeota bacterium]|nr:type II methionyl aminopeptidase [Candidatus Dormibacteraeota bacterium]